MIDLDKAILEHHSCRVRVRSAPRPPRRRPAPRGQAKAAEFPTAELPHPRLGWYAGLAVMAIFEVIEWPLVIVMMLGHEIAHRALSEALRDFAEGVEAGA